MNLEDESEVSLNISEENDRIIPGGAESDMDDLMKVQLNVKAKQDLIDSKGRRFCKYCYTFKVEYHLS